MTVRSGRYAVVNGVGSMRKWTLNETQTAAKAVHSASRGGTDRRKGVNAWSGSIEGYGAVPPVMPNELMAFVGYTSPSNDVSGSGITYSGSAIIDSVAITWNWSAAAIISWVINFSGHLALVKGTGSYEDTTDPDLPEMCGTKVTYSDSDTLITDLTQAVLTITAATQAYVNSSTSCNTGRTAGPIDWTLALTQQSENRVADLALALDERFKLWVDDTEYWDLKFGHIEQYNGITADRETGAIISQTINIAMNGHAVDGTAGYIARPGETEETAWWSGE